MALLNDLNIYDLSSDYIRNPLIAIGSADILICLVVMLYKFDRKYLRDILIISATVSSAVLFFFYPFVAFFVTYGPIVISALYYDRKFIRRTPVLDWIAFSSALWGNVYFEKTTVFMRDLHAYQEVTLWQNANDVLLYRFLPHSFTFFVTFLICSAIAKTGRELIIKNAEESARNAVIGTELAAASDIQRSSLPDPEYTDTARKVRINAMMRPAKVVGGDFYDYFDLGRDIVVLIADVSDKGLPAAIFMMKAKNAIRSGIASGKSLEDAAFSVNNILCTDNREDMLVTMWAAVFNTETGTGKYVNCGHPYPVIRHRDGRASVVRNEPDTVLGVFENAAFSSHSLSLSEGDAFILYTDGLTDAVDRNGELFGKGRLFSLIENRWDPEEPCKEIINGIDGFSADTVQSDDMTILTLSVRCGDERWFYDAAHARETMT